VREKEILKKRCFNLKSFSFS